MMQAWGDCEVRELLDLMKSRWAERAADGGSCRTVVRTSLYVGQLGKSVVGAELYLWLIQAGEWLVTWH